MHRVQVKQVKQGRGWGRKNLTLADIAIPHYDTNLPSELTKVHLLLHSNQTTEPEYSNLWQYLLCMSQLRTVNYHLGCITPLS